MRARAGSFAWDPVTGDHGPRLNLTQTVGASTHVGPYALLAPTTLAGLAANDNGDALHRRRLEVRFGYGFAAFGNRFSSTPEVAVGLSDAGQDYISGWRMLRDGGAPDGNTPKLALEAWRRETAVNRNAPPEHAIGLRLTSRF